MRWGTDRTGPDRTGRKWGGCDFGLFCFFGGVSESVSKFFLGAGEVYFFLLSFVKGALETLRFRVYAGLGSTSLLGLGYVSSKEKKFK